MAQEVLTWQEKVKRGLPLNTLEQVKADAYYITTRRMQEQKEEAERQALKASPQASERNAKLAEELNAQEQPDEADEATNEEQDVKPRRGRKPKDSEE